MASTINTSFSAHVKILHGEFGYIRGIATVLFTTIARTGSISTEKRNAKLRRWSITQFKLAESAAGKTSSLTRRKHKQVSSQLLYIFFIARALRSVCTWV